LDAVDRELSALECPAVKTVFIGGGTPTHLELAQLDRLLSMVRSRFDLSNHEMEWTIEANPEDISEDKLNQLRDHGVNRISLGVQSFEDRKLEMLERGHTGDSAKRTVETVAAKISNVSIDLIFGSPNSEIDAGETTEQWNRDVETALSLPIKHLSTYALTFEKGTSFWSRRLRGELTSLDEKTEVEMYQATRSLAAEAGLPQYEISSFARPGFACQHNLAYWEGQGWFAAGPGAARFVGGHREVNHRSTTTYLKRMELGESPVAESELISVDQFARERLAFGIRMIEGVSIEAIGESSGVDLRSVCGAAIDLSVSEDLLRNKEGRLALTEQGVLFADTVASRFLA
jgi:oxygen-independent coproporphyrinogen-3 oxidase